MPYIIVYAKDDKLFSMLKRVFTSHTMNLAVTLLPLYHWFTGLLCRGATGVTLLLAHL